MKLVWSPEALEDLKDLHAYIARDDPAAATKVVRRVVSLVAERLPDNPASGRPGRVPGTRELVITRTPFLVPYRVGPDRIEILRVYHAARLWPDRF